MILVFKYYLKYIRNMKKILSIDGCGIKGYIPCSLLIELENKIGMPCYKYFDLISGTSIKKITKNNNFIQDSRISW